MCFQNKAQAKQSAAAQSKKAAARAHVQSENVQSENVEVAPAEAAPEGAAPEAPQTATELEASLRSWDQLLLQRTAQELAERHEKRLSQRATPRPLS